MAKDQKEEAKKKSKLPTPLKRRKQDDKKQFNNRVLKSRIHTARVAFEKSQNEEEKKANLNFLNSLIDKASKCGVFKPNKSSRLKSRLAARA